MRDTEFESGISVAFLYATILQQFPSLNESESCGNNRFAGNFLFEYLRESCNYILIDRLHTR